MDDVEREFQSIQEHLGKRVKVTEQFYDREELTRGILQEFHPYSSVEVLVQQGHVSTGQEASLTQTCPFTGVFAGIKVICDE